MQKNNTYYHQFSELLFDNLIEMCGLIKDNIDNVFPSSIWFYYRHVHDVSLGVPQTRLITLHIKSTITVENQNKPIANTINFSDVTVLIIQNIIIIYWFIKPPGSGRYINVMSHDH